MPLSLNFSHFYLLFFSLCHNYLAKTFGYQAQFIFLSLSVKIFLRYAVILKFFPFLFVIFFALS